ncbi:DsrE family protein [Victivallis sp. Marseille-Q1083]|uniref:DsrE family protein n=1 Tax=Victivallis sp. Marseille-Q1083 TaxID=2717288 RepID=UPI001588E174|nr:DsrE family protein [Victivallis sp. Marseille-Q1083]
MTYNLVIHINEDDLDKLQTGLNYIKNYRAVIANENVQVAMLVNGPAVKFFRRDNTDLAEAVKAVSRPNVVVKLCRRAMKKANLSEHDLIGGCEVVPTGIVELVKLQASGFSYVKP